MLASADFGLDDRGTARKRLPPTKATVARKACTIGAYSTVGNAVAHSAFAADAQLLVDRGDSAIAARHSSSTNELGDASSMYHKSSLAPLPLQRPGHFDSTPNTRPPFPPCAGRRCIVQTRSHV